MEFSLPYRAWRSTKELLRDERVKSSSGEPLRVSRDVSFLRQLVSDDQSGGNIDAIYSTQISCIVTGYDQWRWTAIVLAEAWFDEEVDEDENPPPDTLERYENDFQDSLNSMPDGLIPDALCRGQIDATKSEWFPRPYFLRVLEVRLAQVYWEWGSVYYNMNRRCHSHVSLLLMIQSSFSMQYLISVAGQLAQGNSSKAQGQRERYFKD